LQEFPVSAGSEKVNFRELPAKRTVKLLVLLLTSLLIASVTAAVYYSLTKEATVTTAAAPVYFVDGTDSTEAGATGHTTDGTWVRLASLKAYPNATLTYDSAINITATATTTFRLRHGSINDDVSTGNFSSIVFKLIASNGTQYGGDFTYDNADGNDVWSTPSDMSYQNILNGEEWAVKVMTKAASGATLGVVCNIIVYVDVQ
jgi:hypothetical protein